MTDDDIEVDYNDTDSGDHIMDPPEDNPSPPGL
jgi:hypothetical protein